MYFEQVSLKYADPSTVHLGSAFIKATEQACAFVRVFLGSMIWEDLVKSPSALLPG